MRHGDVAVAALRQHFVQGLLDEFRDGGACEIQRSIISTQNKSPQYVASSLVVYLKAEL